MKWYIWHIRYLSYLCLISLAGFACEPAPPSPPDDLEALLGFIFEHTADEDPTALSAGVTQLAIWFEDETHIKEARDGFLINNLDLTRVTPSDVDLPESTNQQLKGVSVVTKSPHCVRNIVGLLTWSEFGSLLESFDSYQRSFNTDSLCMIDRSCLTVTADSKTSSRWAGLVKITTEYHISFRWVYSEFGWALVHRFWLKKPAFGDRFGIKMNANYYVGITIADQGRDFTPPSPALVAVANGALGDSGRAIETLQQTLSQPGSLRIHANWFDVDTGDFPFDDSMIANLLVQQQKNDSENHDVMINTNEIPGSCQLTTEPTLGEEQ
jgi:hypothetical protein